ncbi:transcriptional regulator [Geomonas sp. RF6]|uniref:transcriptional regulator n=1 Tax=Geomonas sp. RF6 TaxID=2897342 RepID=UPI001E5A4E96|nr:transcriptional regulator [Geomonas sp. RF6]UFS71579.1 transcriptional regulator [Geomonas sp. RF6]
MRILIWILLGYLVLRMLRGRKEVRAEKGRVAAAETHRDPVCGTFVAESDAVVGILDGKRHYFCSRSCLERFREEIEQKATPNQSGGKG